MNREIPIFFSADDNYIPYLDVAILSLIANASKAYNYRIIVLNTGLDEENKRLIKHNEQRGFAIDFVDISAQLEGIRQSFKRVYHFSIAAYYRLFIASLFPQYDKIIYLDCDVVVRGDISRLYNTELGDNILGAVADQFVPVTSEFRAYVEQAIGVNADTYFNSGVLLINLAQFRKNKIEQRFVNLITKYNFELLDPDQAYLNYLCYGKTRLLPNGWNKAPTGADCEGSKNIVHYNLYKKPWQYDDVADGEYFWCYARESAFYNEILERKRNFGQKERRAADAVAGDILSHARRIVASGNTLANVIGAKGNFYGKVTAQARTA